MAKVLGFKRHLRPAVVAGEGAYLFGEHGVTALRGAYVEDLVPLLDGTRDRRQVLAGAPCGAPAEALSGLVARLAAADLLAEYPAEVGDVRAAAYWEAAGLDGAAAADRVAGTAVGLTVLGSVDEAEAAAACRTAGLTVTAAASPPDLPPGAERPVLSVVLCDDYLDPALAAIDAAHRAAGRPWLLAKPMGAKVWIGPLFEPGEGGCWTCLSHRLWANRWAEAQVQHALHESGPASRPEVGIAASLAVGLQLTMLNAAHWVAGYRDPGRRDIYVLDTRTMESSRHGLHRRPQCETCGDPALTRERAWRPVSLSSSPKVSSDGGGHRSSTPKEVYDRFRHLISPISGLVADIRRVPGVPEFLHAYVAGENPVLKPSRPSDMRPSVRGMNGGKGVTPLDAQVSALCEALERRSGSFHGDETRTRASYAEVRDRAIHPNACQLYDEHQFRDREQWNRSHAPMQRVCRPLDETVPIDWTPVWSYTCRTHRLLPTGMLYYGTPPESGRGFVRADSNGAAAGSSMEDAVIQGFMELVERDAVALWWYNRTRHPEVDVEAFADPWTARLREVYSGLGRTIWVLDITSDFGIPVMVALSRRTSGPTEDIVFGLGAHFDPHVALRRALTEMNQFLPAALVGDRGRYASDDQEAVRWWREATVEGQPYLVPDPARPATTPADHPWTSRDDLLDDVRAVDDLVRAHGMELLVLDQTRCDIGLPVVRVIVPGMRHFWARFAPGRLYDVPVKMGLVERATSYEDLNPIPVFV